MTATSPVKNTEEVSIATVFVELLFMTLMGLIILIEQQNNFLKIKKVEG